MAAFPGEVREVEGVPEVTCPECGKVTTFPGYLSSDVDTFTCSRCGDIVEVVHD